LSKKVTKRMSGVVTNIYEATVITMTKDGITRDVEDYEREGAPRNNIEWYKSRGWTVVE